MKEKDSENSESVGSNDKESTASPGFFTSESSELPVTVAPSFAAPPAPDLADPDLSGIKIDDNYKIIEKIGEGAAGIVYKAEHLTMNQSVAIKVLKKDLLTNPTAVERFKREAKLSTKLEHAHIARVTAFGVSRDQEPFIVMLFNDGITLENQLKKGPLDPFTTLMLASQILDALSYAHEQGIVHRDIKPANILLLKDAGTLKAFAMLLDFGLAKDLSLEHSQKPNLTQTAFMLGTPNYMSPEQCLAQAVDARSDVYSFGCVLFECLTGRKPFIAETNLLVMDKHLHEQAAFYPTDSLNESLKTIILKCLQKNPDMRYQSALELTRALENISGKISQEEKKGLNQKLVFGMLAVLVLLPVTVLIVKNTYQNVFDSGGANDNAAQKKSSFKRIGKREPEELRESARGVRQSLQQSKYRNSKELRNKEEDRAASLFEQARQGFDSSGRPAMAGICILELGNLYYDQGEYAIAEEYLARAALKLESLSGKANGSMANVKGAEAYCLLANAFFRDNHSEKAMYYWDKAMALCPSDDSARYRIRIEKLRYYLLKDDFVNANRMVAENRSDFARIAGSVPLKDNLDTVTDVLELLVKIRQRQFASFRKLLPSVLEKNSLLKSPLSAEILEIEKTAFEFKQYDVAEEIVKSLSKLPHNSAEDIAIYKDALKQIKLARNTAR